MVISLAVGVWLALITLVLSVARSAHQGDETGEGAGHGLLERGLRHGGPRLPLAVGLSGTGRGGFGAVAGPEPGALKLAGQALAGVRPERLPPPLPAEIGLHEVPLIGLTLHMLSLRDPTAARHAAATARNACELARAAGLSASDQEVAHTAGLLHDLGREAFPDSILVAERELGEADRRLVRRHPVDGARLLGEVPGLEAVAAAILAHHERPDGRGYPYGARGAEIPPIARVLAIAEVYDVLTAPDSYLRPRTVDRAIAELRRVAGTQLDAELVETFATVVARRGTEGFRQRGDADLDAELQLLRRTPLMS